MCRGYFIYLQPRVRCKVQCYHILDNDQYRFIYNRCDKQLILFPFDCVCMETETFYKHMQKKACTIWSHEIENQ